MQESFVQVAEAADKIVGFVCLALPKSSDTAEIMAIYMVPEALGLGAGKALLQSALQKAKSAGYKKVFADATITAKPFYLSQGFVQIGPDNVSEINGAGIEGHPLELKFSE